MMLRNDVTPSDAMPLPAPVENQSEEQGAAVTDSVTPELQDDRTSLVTDPELIEQLRYLQAKKVKTQWTIAMNKQPESTIASSRLSNSDQSGSLAAQSL